MLPVLVLSVVTVVLAEAGYQYTAPSVPSNLPVQHQTNHGSQLQTNDQDKPLSHSVSYKEYTYLKGADNFGSNFKSSTPQGFRPAAGAVLNNANAQTLAPSSSPNLHINSGYSYNSPSVSGNTNSGFAQTSTLSGVNLNAGSIQTFTSQSIAPAVSTGFNNNAFAQNLPSSINLNNGYANTFAPTHSVNLNTGFSNGLAQSNSLSTGFASGNAASSSNLNTGYSYSQPLPSGFVSNSQTVSSAASNLNTGTLQGLQPIGNNFASSGGQSSSISGSSNLNTGYSYSIPHSNGVSFTSGNSQSVSGSASSNKNNGFSQSLPQSNGIGFTSGNAQTSSLGVSSNLNSGYTYSQPQTGGIGFTNANAEASFSSASSNLNTGFQPIVGFSNNLAQPETANSYNNNGYSSGVATSGSSSSSFNSGTAQSSAANSGHYNHGYIQSTSFTLPVSSSASINIAQTSTGTSNSGLVQTQTGSASNVNTGFTQKGPVNEIVYKHIYVHGPPPEFEENQQLKSASPPKKNYKIIFIKVPSYKPRVNLSPAVEHKTLIYVLAKNPESSETIIPKRIPSQHEVFFVKYNGNPLDIAARVNEELDNTGSVQSIVPLQPGLVNGNKY
ncbi:uncharacterized protein LOC113494033 isoform X2 [Trichoplusia ni]|uniref:Uncharacterized protein LOC113494033 isoform X2 n=1 Tax=Trichoplusia ni TaxID=7111 RepID=A0A7E5VID6_TRINI|nr:uncharacterized protein LOC113494033 isoform X2 [Trichoplusia ni]